MTINIDERETRAANNLMNDLIVVTRGIIGVYEAAAKRVLEEKNARLMQKMAAKHEIFASELSNMITRYGGKPVTNTDLGSFARQIWVTVKATVSEGDGPILAEVAADAEKVLNAYGEAMAADLPDDVRDLVRGHTSEVRISYEKLLSLSAAYNN